MLFNSFVFLFAFLPATLALYFLLARVGPPRLAQAFLALASLLFYGYWEYAPASGSGEAGRLFTYVGLLIASTSANYFVGILLQRRPRRWLFAAGIAANLAVLAYFKYAAFGLHTLNSLPGIHLAAPAVILPLAISFYTFTQIAFLVDASRGKASELSFPRYCLFVFFFPHLIAGPIVHHSEIMPQFALPGAKRWNSGNVAAGLCWLSVGLFKKVAIADSCAPLAGVVFGDPAHTAPLAAWAGVLAYAFQLYFDFSGYSDMAIGISLFFNVRLPDNFAAPYRAASIVEFWRGWHITLSRFLRDYLYIPLGGNRHGPFRRHLNLFLTMLLGGLWHGAGWTYLLWGAFHGSLLIVCHLWQGLQRPLPAPVARVLTFTAILIGWAIFRSKDLPHAGTLLSTLAGFSSNVLPPARLVSPTTLIALAGLLVFVQIAPTTKSWIEARPLSLSRAAVAAVLFSIALVFVRNVQLQFSQSEFIYFQF